jgi:hypothetical protein
MVRRRKQQLAIQRVQTLVSRLCTVKEVDPFYTDAREIWTEEEIAEIVDHVAKDPIAGDPEPGMHGLRKLRWKIPGKGKRGGARIMLLPGTDRSPVVLIAVYTKGRQSMLTPDQARIVVRLVTTIKTRFSRNR